MEAPSPADRAALSRQLGRHPRALAGVAARCPFGAPAVVVQRPYDDDGTPFPTTFWLSCRSLVDAVSRLESQGGIADFERTLADRPDLQSSRAEADARVRAVRRSLSQPGPRPDAGACLNARLNGGEEGDALKCLHAHAAVALALPTYAFGDAVMHAAEAAFGEECCVCRTTT